MNGWLRHFVCMFVLLHSFIHSLENRTKTECNVKQKLNGSNFFYFSFYFLLQHSTSFAFWAPPPSSTPSCRCDLEARLRGHFLQRRPSTPRLGLRACIVSRFGCDSRNRGGDLGLGGWLGEAWDLGKKEGLDLPALCSDLSTIPRLGEQWQGEGKSWGWGRDQIGCLILVPISEVWTMSRTTSSFQWQPITFSFCPFDWQFTFWTRTRTGVLKSVLKSAYIRLTENTVFIGSSSRGSVVGGRKAEKASECSVAGFSSSTNELRPWWTFDALFSRHTIAFDVDVHCVVTFDFQDINYF